MNRFLLLLALSLILVGCSSTSENSNNDTTIAPITNPQVTTIKDSQFYIQQAEQYDIGEDKRSFYILAAKSAIAEKKSLLYTQTILANIESDLRNSVTLDIELAKALLYVEDTENAEIVVTRLQQGYTDKRHALQLRIINAQLLSAQSLHLETVRSLFQLQSLYLERLSDTDKTIVYSLLWQHILKVPYSTLSTFMTDFGPAADAWIELANVIQNKLSDPVNLPYELQRWQRIYPQEISIDLLPQQIQQLLLVEPFKPHTIALLLPLSGRLAKQAKIIRDGFISAKPFDSLTTIHIFDTVFLSLSEIETQIEEIGADFIVGPLEKDAVISFQQSPVLSQIPRLNLNIPELVPQQLESYPSSYYFSLSPEDEIDQAIEFFIALGVNKPAVIFADNTLGRRLFERFSAKWQEITEQTAESIAFKNRSKLGDAVQQLLDVDKSNDRIAEMKRLFGSALETEARSRTDIDAVYVIANSQQTRLIKPFFDVNISAFGKRLPIYASSRSYLVDESQAQKRDLNDLVFTEMPWLIKNTEPQLHALYEKIGEQQTQLKKLFAFGYDAYKLIYSLKQLTILPSQSLEGLTGRLSVNADKTIKRQLSWSRYVQGKVVAIPEPEYRQ